MLFFKHPISLLGYAFDPIVLNIKMSEKAKTIWCLMDSQSASCGEEKRRYGRLSYWPGKIWSSDRNNELHSIMQELRC